MAREKFNINEIVFAKLKGYPPWPAKVEFIDIDEKTKKVKYSIFFYGTNQIASCKEEQLFSYLEYRDQFSKPKKFKGFAKAVSEADSELGLNDGSAKHSSSEKFIHGHDHNITYFDYLEAELKVLKIDLGIKRSLNNDRPKFNTCLKLLDDLSTVPITPLIFKKNPELIDTILNLLVYSKKPNSFCKKGKYENWNERKISLIRIKAGKIYDRIQNMFDIPCGKTFLELFADELILFQRSIDNLSENELLKLSRDPTEGLKATI